jgi:hypothetical protein
LQPEPGLATGETGFSLGAAIGFTGFKEGLAIGFSLGIYGSKTALKLKSALMLPKKSSGLARHTQLLDLV